MDSFQFWGTKMALKDEGFTAENLRYVRPFRAEAIGKKRYGSHK